LAVHAARDFDAVPRESGVPVRGLVSTDCETATVTRNRVTAMCAAVTANRGWVTDARGLVTVSSEMVMPVRAAVRGIRGFVTVIRTAVTTVRAGVTVIRELVTVFREVGRCLILSDLRGFSPQTPKVAGFRSKPDGIGGGNAGPGLDWPARTELGRVQTR
jgi:hypothetical protein